MWFCAKAAEQKPDLEHPVHIETTCCFRLRTLIELNMNRDAEFASPAQSHLGCSGVAGGIPSATEAVGQRRP